MAKHELESSVAMGLSDVRSTIHTRCDRVLDDMRSQDKSIKNQLASMLATVRDTKVAMENEARAQIGSARGKFEKQMKALGHTVANCVVGCERLKDSVRQEMADLAQSSEETLSQAKDSFNQALDTAQSRIDTRVNDMQHDHQNNMASMKEELERVNGRLTAGERATAGVWTGLNQAEERLRREMKDAVDGQAESFHEQFKGARARADARVVEESQTLRAAIREAASTEDGKRVRAVATCVERCDAELAAATARLEALLEEKAVSLREAAGASVSEETRRRQAAVEAFKDKHKSIEVRAEVQTVLDGMVNHIADNCAAQDAHDAYSKLWRSIGIDSQTKARSIQDLKKKLDAAVGTVLQAVQDMDSMSTTLNEIAHKKVEQKSIEIFEKVEEVRATTAQAVAQVTVQMQEWEAQHAAVKLQERQAVEAPRSVLEPTARENPAPGPSLTGGRSPGAEDAPSTSQDQKEEGGGGGDGADGGGGS